MKEFLNSKSMLTPGAAGALVMLITSTLSSQFDLPPKWTALAVSALLGLLIVWGDTTLSIPQRGLLFILNSLIVFSVAVGTNTVAVATVGPSAPAIPESTASPTPFFHDWFQS